VAWLKRFSLHVAAAVGATGIFVAAAVVGANQAPRGSTAAEVTAVASTPRPSATRVRTPGTRPTPTPSSQKVIPERSLAGRIKEVQPDGLVVVGNGGREWRIVPAPGALIRLNGKSARLDTLQAGDSVVILGQAQSGPGSRFLAHAITARRK
jgi:hypothetical protein